MLQAVCGQFVIKQLLTSRDDLPNSNLSKINSREVEIDCLNMSRCVGCWGNSHLFTVKC